MRVETEHLPESGADASAHRLNDLRWRWSDDAGLSVACAVENSHPEAVREFAFFPKVTTSVC